jgi:hypothetical protein
MGLVTVEGLNHIHSRGVKQVNIGTYNVLLGRKENQKLSDIAGSSLDGSPPTVAPGIYSAHQSLSTMDPTVQPGTFSAGIIPLRGRNLSPTL